MFPAGFDSIVAYGRSVLAESLEKNAAPWKSAIRNYQDECWKWLNGQNPTNFGRSLLLRNLVATILSETEASKAVLAFFMHKLYNKKLYHLFEKILKNGRILLVEQKRQKRATKEARQAVLGHTFSKYYSTPVMNRMNSAALPAIVNLGRTFAAAPGFTQQRHQ